MNPHLQLIARPCVVMSWLLWTPMAQILLSPTQTPVWGEREAVMWKSLHAYKTMVQHNFFSFASNYFFCNCIASNSRYVCCPSTAINYFFALLQYYHRQLILAGVGVWFKFFFKRCVFCVPHPGCGRSNSGSNPGILPNIVYKSKTRDGERTLLNPGNKNSFNFFNKVMYRVSIKKINRYCSQQ